MVDFTIRFTDCYNHKHRWNRCILTALTNDIGSAKSINVNNTGFDYSITNPPEIELHSLILKDVTGHSLTNTLTTHTGDQRF